MCSDSDDDNKVDSVLRISDKELPSTVKSYATEENKNSSMNEFEKNNCYANPEISLDDALADCLNEFSDDDFSNTEEISKFYHEIPVDLPGIFYDPEIEKKFKTTLEIFVQQCICLSLPLNIDRCIECGIYQMKKNLTKCDYDNISCRFLAFRQLKFTETGKLVKAGYPNPYEDFNDADLDIWLPIEFKLTPSNSDIEAAMKILKDAGTQFCKFVQDENEALKLNWPNTFRKREVVWKKYVSGMREMCDVCKTTIFNYHWSCSKCGFVVCIDCFRTKLATEELNKMNTKKEKVLNNQVWLLCFNKKEHQVDQLTVTQIIPGNALERITHLMHEVCENNNIQLNCSCKTEIKIDSVNKNSIFSLFDEWFDRKKDDSDNETSLLNDMLNKARSDYSLSISNNKEIESEYEPKVVFPIENKSFSPDLPQMSKEYGQINQINLMHDSYESDPPHIWLCDGTLLCLLDHKNNANNKIFQVCILKSKYYIFILNSFYHYYFVLFVLFTMSIL